MSNEIQVPDYLREMMDAGQVENTAAQMDVAAGGVPRLTTKGKVFRFKEGEEEVKAGQQVDVIIVGMHPVMGLSHTYYIDGYTDGSNAPPDCSSMNGVTPDNWITNPQHSNCAKCPNQIWGSAKSMSGGKAKACRDSKQLYLAKASDFKSDPINCTLYLLQVTVNSLKSFSAYGKQLVAMGFPGPQFVLTRIMMDEEASVPKLEFECLGALNKEMGVASYQRSEKKEWDSQASLPPPGAYNNKRALPQSEPEPEEETVVEQTANLDSADVDSLIDNWN